MKALLFKQNAISQHWVGDGFPVRTIFTYNDLAKDISPFLLMDYAGPVDFPPSEQIRGVGEHPHRGFETVTIVYEGEVQHRDSAGGGGQIGPGDVQWMTAASGLVHEEKHGADFAKKGGRFEMIQLWVNLPAKDKMSKPRYQGVTAAQIPKVKIDGGELRVVAGQFRDAKGPAMTFTPINMWDIKIQAGAKNTLDIPDGHTTLVFVLGGSVNGLTQAELGVYGAGAQLQIRAEEDSKLLILTGEPIHEPIVGHGPFVMNTEQEIRQAFNDFNAGKMGRFKGS